MPGDGHILGQLLKELKRYDEAEQALRKSVEMAPDHAWGWTFLGQLLKELKRYDEAEQAFRKSVEVAPDHAWGWTDLGGLLQMLKRYQEAADAYFKRIELLPNDSFGWELLGKLALEQDKYGEAYNAFTKALEIQPESFSVRLNLVALLLGKLIQPAEALALSNDFLNTHDKNPVPYNSFARTFYAHGDRNLLNNAEAWARKAVALDPNNLSYYHTLACILAAVNRGQEALEPAQNYLNKTEWADCSVSDTIELSIGLAAAGCAREALKMLANSHSACVVEPLLVGLRLFIGEDVKAAVEIMEVAKDVVERIKERQQRLMQVTV